MTKSRIGSIFLILALFIILLIEFIFQVNIWLQVVNIIVFVLLLIYYQIKLRKKEKDLSEKNERIEKLKLLCLKYKGLYEEETKQSIPLTEVENLDKEIGKTIFHNLELDIKRYTYHQLFSNIIKYLNDTSEPMSESLVNIKSSIANFIENIEDQKNHYENNKQTNSLKNGIETMRTHISNITQASALSCDNVTRELTSLDTYMLRVLDLVAKTSDVAERIHVLSINASIEASRAGEHGKGFKVIANEIRHLAMETQNFAETITETLSDTTSAFKSVHHYMSENQKMTQDFVKEDTTTFTHISQVVDEQVNSMLKIYSEVLSFIDALNIDMNAFAPLGMLHAIITQEVENLDRIIQALVKKLYKASSNKPLDEKTKEKLVNKITEEIRSKLTTARELDALAEGLKISGLDEHLNLKKVETEIEFF